MEVEVEVEVEVELLVGIFALDRSQCGVDQSANATRANSLVASRLQSGVALPLCSINRISYLCR